MMVFQSSELVIYTILLNFNIFWLNFNMGAKYPLKMYRSHTTPLRGRLRSGVACGGGTAVAALAAS